MILGTLSYNEQTEEGDIELDWVNMPEGVVGLDTLSDWIADLTKIYNRELNHVFTNKLTGVNK
jgi:hypothetical protein